MNWGLLIVLILGGLAIFLHGMTVMTDGLKSAAGSRMKSFLTVMTRNRWTSLTAGTVITAIIQSSSVTTVLAVGFVSAGLLSFQSTLGLILGANLGTTITAQIIAFKVTKAAWVMIASGYLFSVIFARKSYKDIGTIVLGLGLVFLGMNVMSEATEPLKTYQPFIDAMKGLDNPIWGILIGMVFTAAIQSSSATTGIVIILASQGLITVEAGIAIIFGANIGTCVTAVLSATGKPRDAMRVAFSHVFIKVVGVVIWYAFIGELAEIVEWLSVGDKARQIANAHMLFNVANTFIFIWLVKPISKLVLWILPEKKSTKQRMFPELDSYFLQNNAIALDLSAKAIREMGHYTVAILEEGINTALKGTSQQLAALRKKDQMVDKGHAEILTFLQQLQGEKLKRKESVILKKQIEKVNIIESAADVVTTTLVEAAEHRVENGFEASPNTIVMLTELYNEALRLFKLGLEGKQNGKKRSSTRDKTSKSNFKEEIAKISSHLMQRLSVTDKNRIAIFRFESEVLEAVRRIYDLAKRLRKNTA
ncbi:MAG: NAD+ kinase [Draconibacterium sp.]|nr:MAG: NAD+ kinase [Draconibacterium sp.]PIF05629.1 MAG: NAD+ kinase [Draconibacterium sp.]